MKEWKASTELQLLEAFETSTRMANTSLQVNTFYVATVFFSKSMVYLQSMAKYSSNFTVHLIHDPSHHQPISNHQRQWPRQWPRSPPPGPLLEPPHPSPLSQRASFSARCPNETILGVLVKIKLNTLDWSMLYAFKVGDFAIFTASKPC